MSNRYEQELQRYYASLGPEEFGLIRPISDVERRHYDLEVKRRTTPEFAPVLRNFYAQMTPDQFAAAKPISELEQACYAAESERRSQPDYRPTVSDPAALDNNRSAESRPRVPRLLVWFGSLVLSWACFLFLAGAGGDWRRGFLSSAHGAGLFAFFVTAASLGLCVSAFRSSKVWIRVVAGIPSVVVALMDLSLVGMLAENQLKPAETVAALFGAGLLWCLAWLLYRGFGERVATPVPYVLCIASVCYAAFLPFDLWIGGAAWVLAGVLAAKLASDRRRNGGLWAGVTLILGPIAPLIVSFLPAQPEESIAITSPGSGRS